MNGPRPKSCDSIKDAPNVTRRFNHLTTGQWYVVVKSFIDFDGVEHPIGERWEFLLHSFFPYEAGHTFFVSLDGQREWSFRMQHHKKEQEEVLDNIDSYIEFVSS